MPSSPESSLRLSLAALSLALTVVLGSFAAPFAAPALGAAAKTPAKVVIVVGATHGTTTKYRAYADEAYAEAIKYTPNVIKVYSPNATWSKVKAAAVGASVLIYFGHGNGWPSPYTYDPTYTTKDGFGLNATAGNGDYNNKYYGEPYVASLDLAPNAIVLLHHLCYASGNSEPGGTAPTLSVARQRISNYAAGFLKSNAQAVIADGHRGPADYLRALFTTDQTIESLWRNLPSNNGHVSSFTSTRTSGVKALMDPEGTTSGYYRSLVTDPTLTTSMVTGVVDTGADPSTFVVPGRAEVITPDAPLYDDATAAAVASLEGGARLPAGTRLTVVGRSTQIGADGSALLEVQGLDDPSLDGLMRVADLAPRDSLPPRVLAVDRGAGVVSPNGDGRADDITLRASLSESAAWRIRIRDGAGTTLHVATGSSASPATAWDGLVAGAPVADGTYGYLIDATDAWTNQATPATGTIRVDTTAPSLSNVTPAADAVTAFSPNGDGVRDKVGLGGTTSEAGSIVVRVRDAADTTIRSFTISAAAGNVAVTWDGKNGTGAVVPDGTYDIRLTPRDAAGNTGAGVIRTVGVNNLLGWVTTTRKLFFPQDLDSVSRATRLSFTLVRPATVTWTIRNAAGTVVTTLVDNRAFAAGVSTRSFYGRRSDGTMLPTGKYTAHVAATDGTVGSSQAVAFEMNAFKLTPSTITPTRGRSISITATSAEGLSTTPRLYITQPGKATWSVAMRKIATLTYKATVTLKTGGSAGKVTFKVVARDVAGHSQRTSLSLTLR
jgi:flagellar hook assembly protein FlgD